MLSTYEEFADEVDRAGFLALSRNAAGLPCVEAQTAPGQWYTGLADDPWRWRARIVTERRAAYAKVFPGMVHMFVSRQWYPVFLAARRRGMAFGDVWEMGLMTAEAKRIHELFGSRSVLATHELKRLGGFTGKSGRFDSAMAALQSRMFLTISGETRMTTADGRPYSWPVSEYMRPEDWAWEGTFDEAGKLDAHEAALSILAHALAAAPEINSVKLGKLLEL